MSSTLCNVLTSETDPQLTILFRVIHLSNERLFSFKRNKNELLVDLSKRMHINFEKAFVKNKKRNDVTNFDLNIAFFQNEKPVDLNTKNEDFWIDGAELHINDTVYSVHVNLPTITQLKIPNTILTDYLIYPQIDLINGAISRSSFIWFKRKCTKNNNQYQSDEQEWQQIGLEFTYLVTREDLNHELRVVCVPSDGVNFGISQEAISNKDIAVGPQMCPFQARQLHTKATVERSQMRICSYNLLADIYADSEYSQESLYPYCKPTFLSFDYRKLLILKELMGYNADLIFLQEVDKNFMEKGIGPIFENLDYGSSFLCKVQMVEGLSIFYRRSRFSCLQVENHTFSNLLLNCDLFELLKQKVEKNDLLLQRITKLKNSLQILLLNCADDDKRLLLVANLHLYSKDDADHIRLIQAFMCFRYIENMIATIKSDPKYSDHTISLIISGDFNSTPEWGVIKLVKEKTVDSSLEDFRINPQELVPDLELSHNLDIESACGFPLYTNYTQNFKGCLDYILYDSVRLKVVDTVPMPNHEDVARNVALPSQFFPSDHIALVCVLEWR